MSKLDNLRRLYAELELNTPDERELLSRVKNRKATEQELDELFDILKAYPNGARKLDGIKTFENQLVNDIEYHIHKLEEMESESVDVAHLDDESEIEEAYANMGVRYKDHVEKAEEIIEAITEAYFQVSDFYQYGTRLNNAKEKLGHLE